MNYILEYEICALFFLLILVSRFFDVRRFPSLQNKLFGIILVCACVDIVLDIASSLAIERIADIPLIITHFSITLFYLFQFVFPPLILLYIIVLAELYYGWRKTKLPLMMLPAAGFIVLMLTNVFTSLVYYIDVSTSVPVYTRGPLFFLLYGGTVFYIFLMGIIITIYKSRLQGKQFATLLMLFIVLAAAMIIQFMWPKYLLTGVALAAAMLAMFFNLQNPEDMLDLISGTFNYTAMMSFLHTQLTEKNMLWLVAVDVGGIRRVNNSFGVSVGNSVFAQVGSFFNDLEGGVWCFRMYGSRFLLVASTEAEYNRVIFCVERRFERPWTAGQIYTTLSCTMRHFGEPDFFKTAEEVVNLIDNAYTEIQRDGWGTKKQIDASLLLHAQRRSDVESAIRDVLVDGNGFELHYQPVYNIASKTFSGVEALLRMTHPVWGSISPAEFIPIAEQSGLILRIDEYVIKEAGSFLKRTDPEIVPKVELNLSAMEFSTGEYKRLYSLIAESCAQPERVCFEVTETAASNHQVMLLEFMRSLIAAGYSFALDDFGTGFANITQVASLPFSIVKLDRSLLVAKERKNSMLFAGLVEVFSRIGLETIVEGVETEEQALRVARLGANEIQGYLFSTPLPEDELLEFLKRPLLDFGM